MRAVSPCAAEGWLLVCCYYKCNRKLFGSRQLVKSVNNSSWSPRKCDQCERHLAFCGASLSSQSHDQQMASRRRFVSHDGSYRGQKARKAAEFSSMSHLVSRRARRKKASVHRQSAVHEASEQRQTAPGSALATPVARNATNERSPGSSFESSRQRPQSTPSSTRARAYSASRRALGPRQRPSGGQPSCIPEVSAGRGRKYVSILGRRRLRL